MANLLTAMISVRWNSTFDNMNFMVSKKYRRYYDMEMRKQEDSTGRGRRRRGDGNTKSGDSGRRRRQRGWGRIKNNNRSYREDSTGNNEEMSAWEEEQEDNELSNGSGDRYLNGDSRTLDGGGRNQVWDMHHVTSDSKVVAQYTWRWWWLINITYACYWEDDHTPVLNDVMFGIHDNLTSSLGTMYESVEVFLKRAKDDPLIRVRPKEQGIPSQGEDDGDLPTLPGDTLPSPAPTKRTPPEPKAIDPVIVTQDQSLDPREWDWRKYFGLILLLSTVAVVVVLHILGARRQREREQRQVWGNLATKEGLDEILNTAWVLDGTKMQIFDKTKMGYRDDDSIFLGGFEQKETVVGAEITVTYPTTETHCTTNPSDLPPATSPSFLSSKRSGII